MQQCYGADNYKTVFNY